MKMERCPYYSEDLEGDFVYMISCDNPNLFKGEIPICPFTTEYECEIPIHLQNLVVKKNDK